MPKPSSRYSALRMFSRWCSEFIHERIRPAGVASSPVPQIRFSPSVPAFAVGGVAGGDDALVERAALGRVVLEVAAGDHVVGVPGGGDGQRALLGASVTRPFCARIWLCRQTSAARISSRLAGVGGQVGVGARGGSGRGGGLRRAALRRSSAAARFLAALLRCLASAFLPSSRASCRASWRRGRSSRSGPWSSRRRGSRRRRWPGSRRAGTTRTAHGQAQQPPTSGRMRLSLDPTCLCGTNPSVARLAHGAPWLCAPPSRMVCPFGSENLVAPLSAAVRCPSPLGWTNVRS